MRAVTCRVCPAQCVSPAICWRHLILTASVEQSQGCEAEGYSRYCGNQVQYSIFQVGAIVEMVRMLRRGVMDCFPFIWVALVVGLWTLCIFCTVFDTSILHQLHNTVFSIMFGAFLYHLQNMKKSDFEFRF